MYQLRALGFVTITMVPWYECQNAVNQTCLEAGLHFSFIKQIGRSSLLTGVSDEKIQMTFEFVNIYQECALITFDQLNNVEKNCGEAVP